MIKITEKDKKMCEKGVNPTYFITCTVKDGKTKNKLGYQDYGATRTFGFYHKLNDAREALNENQCDMHEYLYQFAIIEKMYPGIHPCCYDENDFEWYKYNPKKGGFYITENPPDGTVNFALG